MGLSAQQLSQPLRLGHLRGDPRRLLRCLERPHGQIRGHHLNWNKRLGTGQDLGRLVLHERPSQKLMDEEEMTMRSIPTISRYLITSSTALLTGVISLTLLTGLGAGLPAHPAA